ncbi:MAG TPA: hypothetical protein PKD10_19920 [Paracoccaceae bacterium]|nr:hypothetical protein [Paracoccaceae bacterium]HMO70252.1 hypothetical protein [Paracoccaceae bacterium]
MFDSLKSALTRDTDSPLSDALGVAALFLMLVAALALPVSA